LYIFLKRIFAILKPEDLLGTWNNWLSFGFNLKIVNLQKKKKKKVKSSCQPSLT
jgi:hypothetical protein